MKKKVSPAIIAAAVVILLAILGFAGYKMFGPQHLPDVNDLEMRKKYFPNGYPYLKDEVKNRDSNSTTPR